MSGRVMGRNITIKGKVKDGDETSPANDRFRVGLMALRDRGSIEAAQGCGLIALKIGAELRPCINPLSFGCAET